MNYCKPNPEWWTVGSGGKSRPGRDADHSPSSSADVKYEQELYLLSPHAPPWRVVGSLYFFNPEWVPLDFCRAQLYVCNLQQ
jgi:hypothetical protein